MKSGKLIAALIGGWLLLIGIDSAHGRIGRKGVRHLSKPLRTLFGVTNTMRTLLLFKLAVVTFLLVAKQLVHQNRQGDEKKDVS